MTRQIVYTFRSVNSTDVLGDQVFVFGRLHEDLKNFLQIVIDQKPDSILGIGNAGFTRYESRAINRFHGKKILKGKPESYDLFVPGERRLGGKPAESFCNWTAYRIAHFIAQNELNIMQSFLHVNKNESNRELVELRNSFFS